jgi:hypothetical protein
VTSLAVACYVCYDSAMAQSRSGAERARLYRARNRCGTVLIQGIEVKRAGIDLLVSRGWLGANVAHDAANVRAALVRMVNKTLTEPVPQPEPSPKPFRRAIQAVKVLSFGVF